MKCHVACWVLIGWWFATSTVAAEQPRVLDERLQISLVASEPDVVTPIGLTFDHRGRLLVIESHTHFPLEDYPGPKTDRILLVEDADGDGAADRFRTFYQGSTHTMSVARGPEDWIYVATRMRVFRVRDRDGDDRADEEEEIARLETAGDYPHNGLCGLCFDEQGGLYFGLGENLGVEYSVVGSDGGRLMGGGEGGSIYHCRLDGADLRRVATGVWNPFGLGVDRVGRLFAVDNDPDASPPCRLLHIVEGGDYGYQFRYGRSGRHPLQAWDGDLPGTLPMLAGTSEAPSAVLAYHGQLYVTSWGENRIERFALQPRGASFSAIREVVVQGDNQFRPVDFALAPDDSLYFTDWVDRSYNVHGQGRVWRLAWKSEPPPETMPSRSDAERLAERLAASSELADLNHDDPFLRQAAVQGLVDSATIETLDLSTLDEPLQTLGVLEAARASKLSNERRDALLRHGLSGPSEQVRLYAIRWIADERLAEFEDALTSILAADDASWSLFRATISALDWLETGQAPGRGGSATGERWALAVLDDDDSPALHRARAVRLLDASHPAMTVDRLRALAGSNDALLQREAVRTLVLSPAIERAEVLASIVADDSIEPAIRADALAGFGTGEEELELLARHADDSVSELRATARRMLRRAEPPGDSSSQPRPRPDELDTWLDMLDGAGNRDAGWRVFFGRGTVRCADCHAVDGQGAEVGPDLTGIARRMGRRRVVQSILEPSREMAPRYVPWVVETTSGTVHAGLSLGVPGSGPTEQFLAADGTVFELPRDQIAARALSDKSIMPEGIHEQFSPDELRDLLTLLGD